MFKVGDLVRRIKVLAITETTGYNDWIPCDSTTNEHGIVVDIEKPIDNFQYDLDPPGKTEIFVRILWQNNRGNVTWHWGTEIVLVQRGHAK